MSVYPPTPRHVPATYYAHVAREAEAIHDDRRRWESPAPLMSECIETAFGFTRCQPGIEFDSDPTPIENRIVREIITSRILALEPIEELQSWF